MTWNKKCWGIFSNIYWTTRFIGMRSIKVARELADPNVVVPKSGRVYVRYGTEGDVVKKLLSQEEVLNHFFNIAFDIASDDVISQLLCRPLGIEDRGPFESYSRGFHHTRFGWSENEDVTQPDGFFFSPRSLIGVELKLGSSTWPEQILKYLALMVCEERKTGKRGNLGLLFIVPEKVRENHLSKIGINRPSLDAEFIARLSNLPKRIKRLFEENPIELDSVRRRVRLGSVSWTWLRDQLKHIESELDPRIRGEQTLLRLLAGLRAQIQDHKGTGIPVGEP